MTMILTINRLVINSLGYGQLFNNNQSIKLTCIRTINRFVINSVFIQEQSEII